MPENQLQDQYANNKHF